MNVARLPPERHTDQHEIHFGTYTRGGAATPKYEVYDQRYAAKIPGRPEN
jgi:hypothetical protein